MYTAWLSGIMANGEPAFASQCIQCGECLEKCPQHLEIPTLLECVVKELERTDLGAESCHGKEDVQADLKVRTILSAKKAK